MVFGGKKSSDSIAWPWVSKMEREDDLEPVFFVVYSRFKFSTSGFFPMKRLVIWVPLILLCEFSS